MMATGKGVSIRAVVGVLILGAGSFVGLGAGFVLHQSRAACQERARSWDNRRDAWIELTMPTPFGPTTDPERLDAERAINEQQARVRKNLLRGLGPRPTC